MNKICNIIFTLLLAGCSTYKVERIDNINMPALELRSNSVITVTQHNSYPEGLHCHEPMLYIFTLGIIPTHCINRYSVMFIKNLNPQEDIPLGTFQITSISGWAALFIAPFPQWKFGSPPSIENEIKNLALGNVK
jgi:hypothetical protein